MSLSQFPICKHLDHQLEEHIDILSNITDDKEILYYKPGTADNKIFEKEFMYLILTNRDFA